MWWLGYYFYTIGLDFANMAEIVINPCPSQWLQLEKPINMIKIMAMNSSLHETDVGVAVMLNCINFERG